jgi:nucleotide-binding universal stress UspA family protein
MRILIASDLTAGSANALRRAAAIARKEGAELRVIHAVPATAGQDVALAARDRLNAALAELMGREASGESGLSVRICHDRPANAILGQEEHYHPDLIVLGAHGEPRLRDAILGTTASHVIREATRPVLIAQGDPGRAYARVMVAVGDEAAGRVVDLALRFAAPGEVHIVHAFGSVLQSLTGATDLLEEVRTDQHALAAAVRKKLAASGRPAARIENIVEDGDEMDVIMRAWTRVRPDLVVMGTHGRTGVAHILHGSLAESVLLGCPSDMLIMRASADDPRDS